MDKTQKDKIKKRNILGVFFLCFCGLTAFLGFAVFADAPERLEVDFFDVGQGDAILIQTPTRHTILIDGGRDTTVSGKIAKELPFYERSIDIVILTHPDLDHAGGLPDVLRRYRVGAIMLPDVQKDLPAYQEFLSYARSANIPLHHAVRGDVVRLAPDLEMTILAPEYGASDPEDLNNSSIVVILKHNKRALLFTGDAEDESERRIMRSGYTVAADVLKLGHHGSRSSSSAAFLKAVGARIGVISAGERNSYGHPHPDVLKRMTEAQMSVYRTDRQGNIEILSDGEFLTITTEKTNP